CLVANGLQGSSSEKLSTPKKSVSYASVRVVLVVSEPVRIVFIGLLRVFLFLLYQRYSRTRASFTKPFKYGASGVSLHHVTFKWVVDCFRVTRLPRQDATEGNTL
ncbi:hypothetical protein, partial [Pseudomonas viridiflava]|uniref:hypothetical protein n=1 Tax=Pseudomonas viridiflava TaxID=33069 RepID=UPI00197EF7FD